MKSGLYRNRINAELHVTGPFLGTHRIKTLGGIYQAETRDELFALTYLVTEQSMKEAGYVFVPASPVSEGTDEDCTHEVTEWGKCVACGHVIEGDSDDEPQMLKAASEMTGCQNRGWYHDGSEEAEAYAQGRAVRPCPHHSGAER